MIGLVCVLLLDLGEPAVGAYGRSWMVATLTSGRDAHVLDVASLQGGRTAVLVVTRSSPGSSRLTLGVDGRPRVLQTGLIGSGVLGVDREGRLTAVWASGTEVRVLRSGDRGVTHLSLGGTPVSMAADISAEGTSVIGAVVRNSGRPAGAPDATTTVAFSRPKSGAFNARATLATGRQIGSPSRPRAGAPTSRPGPRSTLPAALRSFVPRAPGGPGAHTRSPPWAVLTGRAGCRPRPRRRSPFQNAGR